MGRKKYGWTEAKYRRFISDGRGSGTGIDYKPWIYVHESPSVGKVNKYKSLKTGRVHHCLSAYEHHYNMILDWTEAVVDIREQFPLDLAETIRISNEIGIRHPVDQISRFPIVRTTDFLVDIQTEDGIRQVARAVKPTSYLENMRTLELLEIERSYWRRREIDWAIITEIELPRTQFNNLKDILPAYHLEPNIIPDGMSLDVLTDCMVQGLGGTNGTFAEFFADFEIKNHLASGNARVLFKHLIARKRVRVDLNNRLPNLLNQPVKKVLY